MTLYIFPSLAVVNSMTARPFQICLYTSWLMFDMPSSPPRIECILCSSVRTSPLTCCSEMSQLVIDRTFMSIKTTRSAYQSYIPVLSRCKSQILMVGTVFDLQSTSKVFCCTGRRSKFSLFRLFSSFLNVTKFHVLFFPGCFRNPFLFFFLCQVKASKSHQRTAS